MKSLSEQRRIIDAATPGPWLASAERSSGRIDIAALRTNNMGEIVFALQEKGEKPHRDAHFAATARTEWPELLSWAERAREAIEDALLNCATAGDWDDTELADCMRKLLKELSKDKHP